MLALSIPLIHLSSMAKSSPPPESPPTSSNLQQHRDTSTYPQKMKQTTPETLDNDSTPPNNSVAAAIPGVSSSDREQCNPETQISTSYTTIFSNIASLLKWCPTSEQELAKAEDDLLSSLTRPYKTYFVDIGDGWGNMSNKIRTLEMISPQEEERSKEKLKTDGEPRAKQPLVMVHGFAAGIGTWILNLDPISSSIDRKVYAIDLLGFARSTRAQFDLSGAASDVEAQFIDSIERWRCKMSLEKVILLGHSFGGYLCASYALKHPERVSHVILADPWGIQDRHVAPKKTYRFPIWVRAVNSIFQSFNPLAVLRDRKSVV